MGWVGTLVVNTSHLRTKGGEKKQKSSRSGKLPESKKNKELSDVQITAHGRG
jgi:hypothetical protein